MIRARRRPSATRAVTSMVMATTFVLGAAGCGGAPGDLSVGSVGSSESAALATPAATGVRGRPLASAAVTSPASPSASISAPATATTPARRVDPPLSTCQHVATNVVARHPGSTQVLAVRSAAWADTTAIVQLANLVDGRWQCGPEMVGRLGSKGMRPLLDRRSGDDTTPAGVFPLATMTAYDGQRFSFFGNSADPGVTAGAYRRVRPGDCFGATPGTSGYGHLRSDANCPGPDDEYLPNIVDTYSNAALIGANMEPAVSGDEPGEIPYASAIFLHRFTYTSGGATKATSGCVSLAQPDLSATLIAMRSDVLFAMGTTAYLLDTA